MDVIHSGDFVLSSTSIVVAIVLTLALITIFALGLYWLAESTRPSTKPSSSNSASAEHASSTHNTPASRHPLATHEPDEWEAFASSPDLLVQNTHTADATLLGTSPLSEDESIGDLNVSEVRHGVLEAIESLTVNVGASVEEDKPVDVPSHGPLLRCPRCKSARIDTRNRARKAGSAIGSVAGATGGMAAALAGAETGAVVGSIAGPVGTVFGGLAGAVIAGLVGSAAGCAAGSAVGGAIDDNVLDNYVCMSCGHGFSAKQS
ncbi:hypothetical protein [Burkholderia gladioli]|uniref:hypothetical protein n=1 Tax=Burkholderia gladioli TaxID=28095 RepID=UPI001FC8857F|nr:hypothetical protein [Burkholderia gladioli]